MKVEWNEGYEKGYADAQASYSEKTLTPQEVRECLYKTSIDKGAIYRFANLILRKAQEK
jgi:hypothetical protein